MIHLRPAYVPPILQVQPRALVGVGAAAAQTAVVSKGPSAGETGLYMAVPAAGVGALAYFAGLSTAVTLLSALLAGGAGYIFLDKVVYRREEHGEKGKGKPAAKICMADLSPEMKKQIDEAIKKNDTHALQSYMKEARDNGWTCAADEIDTRIKSIAGEASGTEAERKAKLSIDEVSAEAKDKSIEPLATQIAGVLALFTVPTPEAGKEMDYKSAMFPMILTEAQLKAIDDLATSLGSAGYKKAQSQILDVANAAKAMRSSWTPITRADAFKIPGLATEYGLEYPDPSDPMKKLAPDDPKVDSGFASVLAVGDQVGIFVKSSAGAVKPAIVKVTSITGSEYRGTVVDPTSFSGKIPPDAVTKLLEGPSAGTDLHFTVSDVAAISPIPP